MKKNLNTLFYLLVFLVIAFNIYGQEILKVHPVKTAPNVDGIVENLWESLPEITVALGETYDVHDPASITDCAGCHKFDSKVTVNLKAVYNGGKIFVLAKWPDSTASFTRGGAWSFANGSWQKPYPEQSEDRISFFWPIGEIKGNPYNTGGCMAKCHIYYPTDTDPHVSTHGIVDDAWLEEGRADMWHSKAARGAAYSSATGTDLVINPNTHEVIGGTFSMLGFADDKYVDVWAHDSINGEDGGRYGDFGSSGYKHNRIGDKSRPKFMEKNPVDFADAMVLTQGEIDAGECVGDATTGVSDNDAALYWPNYSALNAVIPERILFQADGSRGDLAFGAVWKDGYWTAEISRELINGNDDDIQFKLNEEYTFGVAAFDNSRHGYEHRTSKMNTLQFISEQTLYAGSDACNTCHSGKHADWLTSGHPYKIQKLAEGQQGPIYPPFSAHKVVGTQVDYILKPGVPKPPKGYTWDQIGFVIGGFHSNARFMDKQGYRIQGDSAQYNLITDKWVAYNGTTPSLGSYSYSCYKCHTTGASPDKNTEFEAYPGIEGSWVEGGIGCEGCHGPAKDHTTNFSNIKPPKEGYVTCNKCHARDRGENYEWNKRVEWKKQTVQGVPSGFIRHREQGDMMLNSKHEKAGITCATCHEPHKSVYYENGGLKTAAACANCHPNKEIVGHGLDKAECVDCHMPFAAKNGDVLTPYISEQSAHYWKILTDPITMFANVDTIGGFFFIKQDADGAGGLTLDYTCMQCHFDKDVAWAAQYAENIHVNGIVAVNKETEIPTAYTLAQNYPNPFNPTTTINFSLPKSSFVELNVYAINGELIEKIIDMEMTAGRHSINYNASNLASGVYIYSIKADRFSFSRKMIVLK